MLLRLRVVVCCRARLKVGKLCVGWRGDLYAVLPPVVEVDCEVSRGGLHVSISALCVGVGEALEASYGSAE